MADLKSWRISQKSWGIFLSRTTPWNCRAIHASFGYGNLSRCCSLVDSIPKRRGGEAAINDFPGDDEHLPERSIRDLQSIALGEADYLYQTYIRAVGVHSSRLYCTPSTERAKSQAAEVIWFWIKQLVNLEKLCWLGAWHIKEKHAMCYEKLGERPPNLFQTKQLLTPCFPNPHIVASTDIMVQSHWRCRNHKNWVGNTR